MRSTSTHPFQRGSRYEDLDRREFEEAPIFLADIHSVDAREENLAGATNEAKSEELHERKHQQWLPWWKRPSPYWLLFIMPIASLAANSTTAPRIEVYRMLVCSTLKPDLFKADYPEYTSRSLGRELGMAEKPQQCAVDPLVTSTVATLMAVISVSSGILCLITTAWWGALSDRYGRVKIIGVSMLGVMFNEVVFILAARFHQHIPGGYWFLMVGSSVEGFCGGLTTVIATVHAYLADTTTEHNRSRILSLNLGLVFSGMALGPTFGSLLINATNSLLSVFYLVPITHSVIVLGLFFVLPESVTRSQMQEARTRYIAQFERKIPSNKSSLVLKCIYKFSLIFSFLRPLGIFWPSNHVSSEVGRKKLSRNWNLTLLAIGYGFALSVTGSHHNTYQYASLKFNWSTVTIGYWLSAIGAVRALFLVVILPVVIRILKPSPIVLETPRRTSEDIPLIANQESQLDLAPKVTKKEAHSPEFDLTLARISLATELVTFIFMGFAQTAPMFAIFSVLQAFSMGFTPALQSVVLVIYARRGGNETGKLYGALSVIQAICSNVGGPALYGFVFSKTVTSAPNSMFFVCVASIAVALLVLVPVRVSGQLESDASSFDVEDIRMSSR